MRPLISGTFALTDLTQGIAGDCFWPCRHTTTDAFKAFVAADLFRDVSAGLLCVVAAADHGFRVPVGAIDDVLFWRGERRLLIVFINREKSGQSDVHKSVTQPRLIALHVRICSTASSSFAY